MSIDWSKIYKQYKGLWVALKADEKTVIGSGKSAKEAFAEAKSKGFHDPILTRMPDKLTTYIGFGLR